MNSQIANAASPKSVSLLFVDDEPNVLKALRRLFHGEGYSCYFANSGAEGLALLQQQPIDLIVSDMRMPEMSGAEFLAQAVQQWPQTIRILLTGYADLQSTIDAVNLGKIHHYCNKPWHDQELKLLISNALEQKLLREERDRLAGVVHRQNKELKVLNENLEAQVLQRTEQLQASLKSLDQTNESLKKQYVDSIKAFSRIIEMRPGIKSGHSKYIADQALVLGRKLKIPEAQLKQLFYAGLLSQIGKMMLPDDVLALPQYRMNQAQQQRYFRHAQDAGVLLKGLHHLDEAVILIAAQYACFDGTGRPSALAGHDIPLGARIIALLRDYIDYLEGNITGEPMTRETAKAYLVAHKGDFYDPQLVDLFIQVVLEHESVAERPIIELSITQLQPGMEVEEIVCGDRVFLKDMVMTKQMLDSLYHLHQVSGVMSHIKVRVGVAVVA